MMKRRKLARSINKPNKPQIKSSRIRDNHKTKHPVIRTLLNVQNYQASYQSDLQTHIKLKHDPCTQCDYHAHQPSKLQKHMQSVHEGMNVNNKLQ